MAQEFSSSTPVTDYSERLYNEDLAPVPLDKRTWKTYSIFAMWMSDVHSIGGYTFAAGLFFLGLAGWQVLLALIIGIFLVYFGMTLMGLAGLKAGVPYPVLARLSFGLFGANIPALIRAIIGIFWYGIQTYLASVAFVVLLLRIFPGVTPLTKGGFLGLSPLGWLCFLGLWLFQLLLFQRGMETIRKYQDWCGPIVYVLMIVLLVWILVQAGSRFSLNISPQPISAGAAVLQFFTAIALVVAYFSTLLLNFCDFSRLTPNAKTIWLGNFLGLPLNFTAFSIVSVLVTAGSIAVFGKAITDPVLIVGQIPNTFALIVGALTFVVATVGINIVANFVSPAYDLANVAPRYITFRRGGIIAAIGALVVLPWKIYSNPFAVNYFLGGLAAFLGPLFGIIIVDFYLIKRGQIDISGLYTSGPASPYWYQQGVNMRAVVSFIISAAISATLALVPTFATIAPFSWFIGALLGALVYWLAMANVAKAKSPLLEPAATESVEPGI
jgi:NCS1 family nucleobase:cation symporter-1